MRAPTLLLSSLLLTGCAPDPALVEEPDVANMIDEEIAADWEQFGGEISAAAAITVADLLADPAAHDGKTILVEGSVEKVCKKKGCWMTLASGDQSMRIRFKDYGFFVPLDCEGRTVRVEGDFTIENVPADELRHYLEDEGKPEEAAKITEDGQEFRLLASGVRMK